jgi:hypothetical protein
MTFNKTKLCYLNYKEINVTYKHELFLGQCSVPCDLFAYLHVLVLGLVIYDCLDARLVVHVLDVLDTFYSKNVIGMFLIFGLHYKEILHVHAM